MTRFEFLSSLIFFRLHYNHLVPYWTAIAFLQIRLESHKVEYSLQTGSGEEGKAKRTDECETEYFGERYVQGGTGEVKWSENIPFLNFRKRWKPVHKLRINKQQVLVRLIT